MSVQCYSGNISRESISFFHFSAKKRDLYDKFGKEGLTGGGGGGEYCYVHFASFLMTIFYEFFKHIGEELY